MNYDCIEYTIFKQINIKYYCDIKDIFNTFIKNNIDNICISCLVNYDEISHIKQTKIKQIKISVKHCNLLSDVNHYENIEIWNIKINYLK